MASDPRVEFTGAVAPAAVIYSGPITLPISRTIRARVLDGTNWSALNQASFSVGTVAAAAGNLVLSKIHYRPLAPSAAEIAAGFAERSDFEFVEVLNVSNNRITLDGVTFGAGLDVEPLTGGVRELGPGERALYVANVAAFALRYGSGLPLAGTFTLGSNLDNNGEELTLLAANATTIVTSPTQTSHRGRPARWERSFSRLNASGPQRSRHPLELARQPKLERVACR
jgi:hypothetical protein